MWKPALTWLLVAAFFASAHSELVVTETTDSFEVSLDGVKLFEHRSDAPLMSVGAGDFEAVSFTGMYEITDVETEKVDLKHGIVKAGKIIMTFLKSSYQTKDLDFVS